MTDLARQVRGDELPALDVVEFLLGHYGLVEPSPHILLSSAPSAGAIEVGPGARDEITEMMRAADIGRVGIGVDRRGRHDVHRDRLAGAARDAARADSAAPAAAQVTRRSRPSRARPHPPGIAITAPDGPSARRPSPLRDGVDSRRAPLRRATGGTRSRSSAAGKTAAPVLANFPVYCGVRAADGRAPRRRRAVAKVTAEEAERQMLALINRNGARADAAAVALDEQLAAVARAHTREMVEHDFVGHVSPRTGTAMDRVHRAGLTPTFVSENVGRGYTAEEAEQGFMSSPGHRANIVDPRPRAGRRSASCSARPSATPCRCS